MKVGGLEKKREGENSGRVRRGREWRNEGRREEMKVGGLEKKEGGRKFRESKEGAGMEE